MAHLIRGCKASMPHDLSWAVQEDRKSLGSCLISGGTVLQFADQFTKSQISSINYKSTTISKYWYFLFVMHGSFKTSPRRTLVIGPKK